MSRDHRKLRVFNDADAAVEGVYRATQSLPDAERFGLQSQMRRAAVSVPSNIVEGCARRSASEYAHFLNVATASAAEVAYLLDLGHRLGFMNTNDYQVLAATYAAICAQLKALLKSLE